MARPAELPCPGARLDGWGKSHCSEGQAFRASLPCCTALRSQSHMQTESLRASMPRFPTCFILERFLYVTDLGRDKKGWASSAKRGNFRFYLSG